MLRYRGHVFADSAACSCCVGDERVAVVDPTGTGRQRRAFNTALAIKWRQLKGMIRTAITSQDILSFGQSTLMRAGNPAVQGSEFKIKGFQAWLDYALAARVLEGDGSFMRGHISRGYDAGKSFAQGEVGSAAASRFEGDRVAALQALAVVELQGIIEAFSQAAVRAVSAGLLSGERPSRIVRSVLALVDKIGVSRSTALVELIVVRAFSEATLDVYEASGVTEVGLLPEMVPVRITTDAKKARRKKPRARAAVQPRGRSGTRGSREEAPSERTIQRIKAEERAIEAAAGRYVNVKTAGDKKVCQVCKKIAAGGPYKINKARALIPAHPRCRCVFVPVSSRKRKSS